MRTQSKEGTARRDRRAVLSGVAALAIAAGLALPAPMLPSDAQIWPTAEAAESDIEYVGSTEVTLGEAAARAAEARAEGEPEAGTYKPGAVLIQTFPETSDEALRTAAANAGVSITETIMRPQREIGAGGIYLAELPAGASVREAIAKLLENTQIQYATPNMLLSVEGDEGQPAGEETDDADGSAEGTADAEIPAGDSSTGGVAVEAAAAGDEAADEDSEETAASGVSIESAAEEGVATEASVEAISDPAAQDGRDWAYSALDYEGAWAEARKVGWRDSSSVTVAVMDTGINTGHEDLQGNIGDKCNFYASTMTSSVEDVNGHGTEVAGIISSKPNDKGTVGISRNAKIMPMVVTNLGATGSATGIVSTDAVGRACQYLLNPSPSGGTYASNNGVRVVNISAGEKIPTTNDYTICTSALQRLANNNILVVNSAGNRIVDTAHPENNATPPYDHWPTSVIECIGVIALRKDSNSDGVTRLETSNYNLSNKHFAQLSAPGHGIFTTYVGGSAAYATAFQGTSSAAPFVSGTAALMFAVCPSMTAAQAKQILVETATDLTASPAAAGFDTVTGYGMVNPKAAVARAVQMRQASGPIASYNGLANMKLRLGGESISDFDPQAEPYGWTKDHGLVSATPDTTVSLYGYDRTAWRTANVTTSTTSQSVTGEDGKPLVEYTRVQRYTFESLYNGAGGSPLSRTYVFTTTWTLPVGSGVQAEDAIAGTKVSIGGQDYADFTSSRHSYEIQYPSKDAMPSEAPQFSNLPAGWTAATKGDPTELPTQRIDNGDGSYTERGGRSYVVTVTGGGVTIEYTFNYTYSQRVEGTETQAEAQSEAPQAPVPAQPAVEGTPAAKSEQQGGKGSLLQTGDPVVIIAVCVLVATVIGGIVFFIVKKKRSA